MWSSPLHPKWWKTRSNHVARVIGGRVEPPGASGCLLWLLFDCAESFFYIIEQLCVCAQNRQIQKGKHISFLFVCSELACRFVEGRGGWEGAFCIFFSFYIVRISLIVFLCCFLCVFLDWIPLFVRWFWVSIRFSGLVLFPSPKHDIKAPQKKGKTWPINNSTSSSGMTSRRTWWHHSVIYGTRKALQM